MISRACGNPVAENMTIITKNANVITENMTVITENANVIT